MRAEERRQNSGERQGVYSPCLVRAQAQHYAAREGAPGVARRWD